MHSNKELSFSLEPLESHMLVAIACLHALLLCTRIRLIQPVKIVVPIHTNVHALLTKHFLQRFMKAWNYCLVDCIILTFEVQT